MDKVLIEEKKINNLVKKAVNQALQDLLSDPDFGLELEKWVKNRLGKKKQKTISLKELGNKYL